MTKKVDETLKKTGFEKEKTSLKISRKNSSKTTKKVILETPILEQIPEKKSKRTISRKKPEPKAIGSLNAAKKLTITSPHIEQENSIEKTEILEVQPSNSSTTKIIDKLETQETSTLNIESIDDLENKKIDTSKIETTDNLEKTKKCTSKIETTTELKNKKIEKSKNKEVKTKTKKSNTTLTPNTPMPNSKKNSRILDNKQILVKPKRTLKLNLGNRITSAEEEKINSIIGFSDIPIVEASPIPKKNVTINQNSSFFYEPSIFEKFNITVSNIDEEVSEKVENNNLEASSTIEFTENTNNTSSNVKTAETNFNNQTIVVDEQPSCEENTDISEVPDNSSTEAIENDASQIEETTSPVVDEHEEINTDAESTSNKDEEVKNVEEELINALLDEIIEEQLSEPKPEQENFDFVSDEVPEELKETFEKNLELSEKKQKFIEDASNEYDFISTETPDIYKPYFSSNNFDISDENTSENIENEIATENLDNNSDISITDIDISDTVFDSDNIIDSEETNDSEQLNTEETINNTNIAEDHNTSDIVDEIVNDLTISEDYNSSNIINEKTDISNSEDTNLLEIDFTKKEVEHNEAADNLIADEILKETQEKANDTAVGKFFDSSIPSIPQESDASYFTKIKKSLFSNISTVFKKFSYEEASLLKSEKETLEEASPIIELSKPSSTDEIKQVLENFDNNENTIKNLEVSASQNTLVLPTIDEKVLEAKEISPESVQDTFTNIITPPTTSTDDISLDDIDLNDIDINDLELSDIDDILDQTDEQPIENKEESSVNEPNSDIIEELYDNTENLDVEISENLDENSNYEELEKLNENSEDDFYSQFTEQNNELDNKTTDEIDDEIENLSEEDIDEELNEVLGIEPDESDEEDAEHFSIEEYFGVTPKEPVDDDDDEFVEDFEEDDSIEKSTYQEDRPNIYQEQMNSFSKLIENFTQTISTLSNKISELENNISSTDTSSTSEQNKNSIIENNFSNENDNNTNIADNIGDNTNDIANIDDVNDDDTMDINDDENIIIDNTINDNIQEENSSDINLEDISIDDISLDDISLEDLEALEETTDEEEPSLLPIKDEVSETTNSVEDILLKAFDNPEINNQMKQDLLSEVLSVEDELPNLSENIKKQSTPVETETTSDFFKIIDSLSKTISELEKAPDFTQENLERTDTTSSNVKEKEEIESTSPAIVEEEITSPIEEIAPVPENTSDKAINILINKDDIFSIAILNETYEIVTDFDGISVISENIHISTPKNNFYVNIGDKYIEIHKQPDLFVVNTNFEDIEFANAINNVTFAKKKNKIELNIKAAFKISSVNKKIELSMLNTSIANLTSSQETSDDNSSICDNKTLVINEETQKVYLPYTIEEVMKKLNNSSDYQSLEDVIEQEYTLPLSTFKMPIISRFKEAYRFMRTKEKSSVYAALDLAVELMFNSNLNPAVIRASKDLKELNIYLDCLYENELEKFDCFKVIYKVLPKIQ